VSFLFQLLFEDLTALVIVEFIAMAVVLAVHRQCRTAGTRRAVWITLACCAFLVLLNQLVTTDSERIEEAVATLAKAVDDGEVPAIGSKIDDEFQYRHWDKAGFVAELNNKLQDWRIDAVKVGRFDVQIEGDLAKVSFRASCDWKGRNESQAGIASVWTQEWVRRPDGWKLRRIVSAKVGPAYQFDLNDVWNY
jgi:hypothetical protein